MDAIMAVYPRHKKFVEKFIAQGTVIGIGPFAGGGNMAIFKSAETFSCDDPFFLEGLVKTYILREWNDSLIPE